MIDEANRIRIVSGPRVIHADGVTEQIPGLAFGSQLGNVGVFGPTNKAGQMGLGNPEKLWNFFTALGITGAAAVQDRRSRGVGG